MYTELVSHPDGMRLHGTDGTDWLGGLPNIGGIPAGVNPLQVARS